ncbi:ABC transporter substrate-binding protein [Desulfobacterales bacterium HSG17]|nr:ABC transporter substrate-binding protein [Desulfobacterales bacterium HSG17]
MRNFFCYGLLLFTLFLFFCDFAGASERIRVTFLNPGVSDTKGSTGSFWMMVNDFMQSAAQDLDIELEVLFAERDHINMRDIGIAVTKRTVKPDYLVIVNEMLQAGPVVEAANNAGIKTFLILNTFTGKQAKAYGPPRTKYPHWIGSLVPNNFFAGYTIGKLLVEDAIQKKLVAADGKIHMVAIAGDHVTPASVERVNGLNQALIESSNVELKQTFYAQWRKDSAVNITIGALHRYPEVSAIWCANDPIALGAMQSAVGHDRIPGRDLLVGGLNWSIPALEMVKDGTMVTSVGGHFMTGGWALVLLHDYHQGKDFASLGTQLNMKIFGAITKKNVMDYLTHFSDQNWDKIDFTRFSLDKAGAYEFSLEKILEQF